MNIPSNPPDAPATDILVFIDGRWFHPYGCLAEQIRQLAASQPHPEGLAREIAEWQLSLLGVRRQPESSQ
jgi:hypothetical protein